MSTVTGVLGQLGLIVQFNHQLGWTEPPAFDSSPACGLKVCS
jgi:hypothetical protein